MAGNITTNVKVTGLKDALAAIEAAFPKDINQQRSILNQAMSAAGRKTMVPIAKQLAFNGDSSGALSESIGMRAVSRKRAMGRGMAATVNLTPVRSNKKAIAKYVQHYYNSRGKAAPSSLITDGIRHGHLVEFGHKLKGGGFVSARPFLGPAMDSGKAAYIKSFAAIVKKKIESAVKRRAKRTVKR